MARKVLFVLMLVMGLGLTYGLGRSDWLRRNGTPEPAARIEPEPAASSTPAAHESTRESDEATSTTTPGVIEGAVAAIDAEDEARVEAAERQVAEERARDIAAEIEAAERRIAEELARQRAQDEARRRAAEAPTPTLHPRVQEQGEALVLEVVENYGDAWPWVQGAWEAADVSFYEGRLPAPCEDARACVLDDRRMWFTLDSLRSDDREHAILHELGHVSSAVADPDGSLLAGFRDQFAGCYTSSTPSEQLPEELLVDAVVQAVRGVSQEGYGYYAGNLVRDGHFAGCLVDGGSPPPHLVDSIWQTLFNCGSPQARGARHRLETRIFLGWHERETLAAGHPVRVSPMQWRREPGDVQALSLCHGIECESIGEVAEILGLLSCDWPGYDIDCASAAASKIFEEWSTEQYMPIVSSWEIEALSACHGIVCEGTITAVSPDSCTVTAGASEGE